MDIISYASTNFGFNNLWKLSSKARTMTIQNYALIRNALNIYGYKLGKALYLNKPH